MGGVMPAQDSGVPPTPPRASPRLAATPSRCHFQCGFYGSFPKWINLTKPPPAHTPHITYIYSRGKRSTSELLFSKFDSTPILEDFDNLYNNSLLHTKL